MDGEFSVTVRLLSIKSNYDMLKKVFNAVVQLMKEIFPLTNCVLTNYGKMKKVVKNLGNHVRHMYCCRKG